MMKLENILIVNFLFLILTIENSAAQDMHKVDSLKALLETAKEDTIKVNIMNSICTRLWEKGNFDSAFFYAENAKHLAEKLYFKKGLAISYNNIGIVYHHKGEINKALECYLKSLKINEQIENNSEISFNLGNIGLIYQDKGNYNKALEYHFKALKLDESLGKKNRIARNLSNIGIVHDLQGKYSLALEYYFKALALDEELGIKNDIVRHLTNIGIVYYEQASYSKALEFFFKALKIDEELDNKNGIAINLVNMGSLYIITKKYNDARVCLEKSLQLAKEIGNKELVKENCLNLSVLGNTLGDWKSAYEYHKLYTAVKDSIFNEESTKSMHEIQTKYETEKKEKEIEMLTKDNELQVLQARQQENQIRKQWLLIIGIVFILGLSFSLMYVIYSQFKFKKAANEELELKNRTVEAVNKELDKKNKSAVESINYAQRIQETIMPTQNQLQKLFPESFIFYKAKDVVSGDFPWVWSSNGNNANIFVSAVDCTGHGVPGAMMSMIGYFLLNEIVNDRKIQMPSEILNHLHEGIKQTLRQEENLESKDGMDIALCTIHKERMEVQFAGAHRPMLWLHNGEIIEVKGNRFPIGGLQYSSRGKEIKFTNHILKLEKGDSIYFYSDGLVDQLSSESGKRFKNNQVKKIILENQHKPMQEIHDIMDKEFIKWMGNEKQLDDVLMVGIRM